MMKQIHNHHSKNLHLRIRSIAPVVIILLAMMILLSSCKSTPTTVSTPTQQNAVPTYDQQLQSIKETIAPANSSLKAAEVAAAKAAEQASQTVFVPIPQNLPANSISVDYKAPCLLQNYKFLNTYCSAKNFWHNQSTLLSWYIPYSFVLLALIIIAIMYWLARRK